jgi:hypothetical protein
MTLTRIRRALFGLAVVALVALGIGLTPAGPTLKLGAHTNKYTPVTIPLTLVSTPALPASSKIKLALSTVGQCTSNLEMYEYTGTLNYPPPGGQGVDYSYLYYVATVDVPAAPNFYSVQEEITLDNPGTLANNYYPYAMDGIQTAFSPSGNQTAWYGAFNIASLNAFSIPFYVTILGCA